MNFKNQVLLLALLLAIAVSQDNSQCSTYDNITKVCTACYGGYYLDATAFCAYGNPHCANFTTDGTGNCANCWSTSFSGPLCAVVPPVVTPPTNTDPYCAINTTNGVCTGCYGGYYLNNAKICTLGNQNCANLTSPDGLCGACHSGYDLINGDCIVPAPANYDPYCVTQRLGPCPACIGGYYLNTLSVCTLANPLCAKISAAPSNGECLSCYAGYYVASGLCVVGDPYCIGYAGSICSSCYFPLKVSTVDRARCVFA
jgi:hypothetical protein